MEKEILYNKKGRAVNIDEMNAEQIDKFLRDATGEVGMCVCVPDKKRESDYMFALFTSSKDLAAYKDGFDSEQFIIWNAIKREQNNRPLVKPIIEFGFSYNVHTPAVMYHKDMSGTPADDEMIEFKQTFDSLFQCVESLAEFIFRANVDMAKENYNYSL